MGGKPVFCVVDDVHGYVAQTEGVLIVGRPAHSMWHLSRLRNEVFDRMVPEPMHGKSDIVMATRDEAPRIKGPKEKTRKLIKGIRP